MLLLHPQILSTHWFRRLQSILIQPAHLHDRPIITHIRGSFTSCTASPNVVFDRHHYLGAQNATRNPRIRPSYCFHRIGIISSSRPRHSALPLHLRWDRGAYHKRGSHSGHKRSSSHLHCLSSHFPLVTLLQISIAKKTTLDSTNATHCTSNEARRP